MLMKTQGRSTKCRLKTSGFTAGFGGISLLPAQYPVEILNVRFGNCNPSIHLPVGVINSLALHPLGGDYS